MRSTPNIFAAICLLLITAAAWGKIHHPTTPYCPHCNVVVIMIDSLRADALPCYGHTHNTAPGICSFAKKNLIFSKTFSNSSWTLPSELSFFTSLYPEQHTIGTTLTGTLHPYIEPLPLLLRNSGYDTTFVANNQPNIGLRQGLSQGFTTIQITPDDPEKSVRQWTDAIMSIKTSNMRRKPAFVYLHTDGVHNYLNHEYSGMHTSETFIPALSNLTTKHQQLFKKALRNRLLKNIQFPDGDTDMLIEYTTAYERVLAAPTIESEYDVFLGLPKEDKDDILSHVENPILIKNHLDEYVDYIRQAYDDHIRQTDKLVTKALDTLERQNLLKNTIVILTSEHGELLGEGNLIGHGQKMYNPETSVPLILHIPKVKHRSIDTIVQLIDIYPTIFTILGIFPPRHTMSGISLIPYIYGEKNSNTNTYAISQWTNTWRAVTMQNREWKWFENIDANGKRSHELYHIQTDPHESVNRAGEYSKKVQDFIHAYYSIIKKLPVYHQAPMAFPVWIDEEHRKNLIETGYFDRGNGSATIEP